MGLIVLGMERQARFLKDVFFKRNFSSPLLGFSIFPLNVFLEIPGSALSYTEHSSIIGP